MQFTYSFPPMIALGYDIRLNAMRSTVGEGFDPQTGRVTRKHSGVSYWVVGFFGGSRLQTAKNTWHLLYALGAWAMAGLGMYAAIEGMCSVSQRGQGSLTKCAGMIEAFKIPQVNSFSCTSPLDLSAST